MRGLGALAQGGDVLLERALAPLPDLVLVELFRVALRLLRAVVGVAARVFREAAVRKLQDAVRDGVQEVAVVGDDERRGAQRLQALQEVGDVARVQVIGRLVQEEQARLLGEDRVQRRAGALAAGERVRGPLLLAQEAQRAGRAHKAGVREELAGDQAQERGLARAVRAHKAHAFAGFQGKGEIVQQGSVAQRQGEAANEKQRHVHSPQIQNVPAQAGTENSAAKGAEARKKTGGQNPSAHPILRAGKAGPFSRKKGTLHPG